MNLLSSCLNQLNYSLKKALYNAHLTTDRDTEINLETLKSIYISIYMIEC